MDILIREMTMEDYKQVYALWTEIKGFGIRSIDDSEQGVERFLRRNPTTSVVAVQNGRIIGKEIQEPRRWLPHGPGSYGSPAEGGRQQDQPGGI